MIETSSGKTENPTFAEISAPCRLGVLLSGRGSNFAALHQAIENGGLTNARIVVVISNRPEAPGLQWAKEQGLTAVSLAPAQNASASARDAALEELLASHRVDLLLLAGYDRIIGPKVLAAYPGRILNIHPSLLPNYGGRGMIGLNVHAAVLANKEKESGCTVHQVTDVIDGGVILGQARVPVLETDTPHSLAERVLEQEHRLYPQVVQAFIRQAFPAIEAVSDWTKERFSS